MRRLLILLAVAWAGVTFARAETAALPPVVARGFESLGKDGILAAIDTWLAGSVHEADDQFQDEAARRMEAAQRVMGRFIGFEVVRVVPLTPSTCRVYAAAKLEKGVGWMWFDCYQPKERWIVCRLAFHPSAAAVLPPELLSGGRAP